MGGDRDLNESDTRMELVRSKAFDGVPVDVSFVCTSVRLKQTQGSRHTTDSERMRDG